MKQLNEQLNRIFELMELNIQQKKNMGNGVSHTTYPSQRNPDSVYKIGVKTDFDDDGNQSYSTHPVDSNHLRIFQQFPQYFPRVISTGAKHLELEKLNMSRVYDDVYTIREALNNARFRYDDPLRFLYEARNPKVLEKLFQSTEDKTTVELMQKYITLIRNIEKDVVPLMNKGKNERQFDVHIGQFGYDKSGNLKMLDF